MRFRFHDCLLNTETGELFRDGLPVPLRRQAYRLLQVLVERAPALISRDELLDAVWGHSALSPNVLPQTISELRQALGDSAQAPRYVETRHRRGYRLLARVVIESDPPHGHEHSDNSHTTLATPTVAVAHAATSSEPVEPPQSTPAAHRARTAPGWRWKAIVLLLAVSTLPWIFAPARDGDDAATNNSTRDSVIAIGRFPAADGVPAWVPGAALELLTQSLQTVRGVRVLRSDALGLPQAETDARWQILMHDLLGAPLAATGQWRGNGTRLRLDLSILDLGSGRVIEASHIEAPLNDFEALASKTGDLLLAALHRPVSASTQPRGDSAQRTRYWQALSLLQRGDAGAAARELQAFRRDVANSDWVDFMLVRALRESGQSASARALIAQRLERAEELPLGERLRLQAEDATLRHQPEQAAAALRALLEIEPENSEHRLALIARELDALQGDAARESLARLEADSRVRSDPRLLLLRARMARLSGDLERAAADAESAARSAEQHDLPALAVAAALDSAATQRVQGELAAAINLLDAADTRWSTRLDPSRRIELQQQRLSLLRELGRSDEALQLFSQLHAESLHSSLGARVGIEGALTLSFAGRHTEAQSALDAVQAAALDPEQPAVAAAWYNASGLLASERRDTDTALQAFEQAFSLARRHGLGGQMVALQVNAGRLMAQQQRLPEAERLWTQSLEIFERLGDRRGEATCLGNLATLASMQGMEERADSLNRRALALFEDLQLSGPVARTAYNLGLVARRNGRLQQADQLFRKASSAWAKEGQNELHSQAVTAMAEVRWLGGDDSGAATLLDGDGGDERDISALRRSHRLSLRARLALDRGEMESARHLESSARGLRVEAGARDWTAFSDLALLRLDLLEGKRPLDVAVHAESLAQQFLTARQSLDASRAWLLAAEARLSMDQRQRAQQALDRASDGLEKQPDMAMALDLDWVESWTYPAEERRLRLLALRDRARAAGFLRQARRVELALDNTNRAGSGREPLPPYARGSS